jgi:3-deoxy-D-manno-octulosonic acid kinase
MQAEFGIHAALEAADAPVPELLGVCWARRGMGYFGAIATRYVEAPTLLAWLATGPVDAITSLRACGAAIRSVHELGVLHADLNAANILIGARGPLLIDFDRATRHRRLSLRQRAANLLRLRRSLRKAGYSDAVFEGICEGYGGMHLPRDMMWLDELRCWLRGHPRPKDRVSR